MEKITFLILIFCFSFNDVSSQNVDTLLFEYNNKKYGLKFAPPACYPLSDKSQHVLMSEWINHEKWSTDKPFDNLYTLYLNDENYFKTKTINNLYMFFNDEKLYMVSYEPYSDQYHKNKHYTRKLYLYYLDGHVWKIASDILIEDYFIQLKNNSQKLREYYSRQHEDMFYIKKMDNGIVKIKLTGNENRVPYNLTVVLKERGDGTYKTLSSELIK